MFSSFRTAAGSTPKTCGVGQARDGMVCGAGAGWKCAGDGEGGGKIFQIPGVWGKFKFCVGVGRERTKNFSPCRTLLRIRLA